MKRFAAITLALIMALICVPVMAEKADREIEGNLAVFTTAEDFAAGKLENVVTDESIGNGAIVLKEGESEGTYTSEVLGTAPFEYMVASWGADTPTGTWIEVSARAYVDMKKGWTEWLSWGKWSDSVKRGSVSGECDLAYISTDEFTISGKDGETASKIQLKVTLHANADGVSPTVRQLGVTYKNTLEGQYITPVYHGETVELPEKVLLDTPAYSQMVREQSIANSMCSATTICTLLNDRGEDTLPEEIALIDYDSVYDGFGNWAFSVAAAGSYGYDVYIQYADLDIVRQELAHGYSVGINVKYSSSSNGQYPYLENGAAGSTGGHLITITGYETIDGVDYFYSSDSAAGSDAGCLRRYRADQLDAAWSAKVAYIIHDKEENISACNPNRVECELVSAGENEYTLMANGEAVQIGKNFTSAKWKSDGCGIIAYYLEGEDVSEAPMPENVKTSDANHTFRYTVKGNENGNLAIKPTAILGGLKKPATMHIFVMANNGTTYTASLELVPEVTETPTPAPTEAPAESEAPAATAEPAPAEPAATEPEGGLSTGAIVGIIAAVIVAAAVIIIVSKKKK